MLLVYNSTKIKVLVYDRDCLTWENVDTKTGDDEEEFQGGWQAARSLEVREARLASINSQFLAFMQMAF